VDESAWIILRVLLVFFGLLSLALWWYVRHRCGGVVPAWLEPDGPPKPVHEFARRLVTNDVVAGMTIVLVVNAAAELTSSFR
jgi:hypothetical protein